MVFSFVGSSEGRVFMPLDWLCWPWMSSRFGLKTVEMAISNFSVKRTARISTISSIYAQLIVKGTVNLTDKWAVRLNPLQLLYSMQIIVELEALSRSDKSRS